MNVTLDISYRFSATVPDSTGTRSEIISLINKLTTNGVGADQVDQLYAAARTVADSSTPDVMDLRGGTALIGSDRSAFSVIKLSTLIVVNYSLTQWLKVKPAAANGLTGAGTPFEGTTGIWIPPSPGAANNYFSHFVLHGQGATIFTVSAGVDSVQVETDTGTLAPYVVAFGGRSA